MKFEDRIRRVFNQIIENGNREGDGLHELIINEIVRGAAQFFVHCQEDFCVKSIKLPVIVFGEANALYWEPLHGFSFQAAHCTPEFRERARNILNKTIRVSAWYPDN